MKLALVKLLQRISTFPQGLEFILEWQAWRFCTDFNDFQYTNPIIMEQAKLVVNILIKLEDANRYEECQKIVDVMIDPVLNRFWYDEKK